MLFAARASCEEVTRERKAGEEEPEPAFRNCDRTGETLSEKDLRFCLRRTRFDKKTILLWFKSFRSECPEVIFGGIYNLIQ